MAGISGKKWTKYRKTQKYDDDKIDLIWNAAMVCTAVLIIILAACH